MPTSSGTRGRSRVSSEESPSDDSGGTVEWHDVGRRRWTLRIKSARTSKNLLLASVFIAMMLHQLLWTTVGKCVDSLPNLTAVVVA